MAERDDILRALEAVDGITRETIEAVRIHDVQVSITLAGEVDEDRRRTIARAAIVVVGAMDGVRDVLVRFSADAGQN